MSSTSTLRDPRVKPVRIAGSGPVLSYAPPEPERETTYGLQVFLLVVTLFTTTLIGMRYMYNFNLGEAPLTSGADVLPYQWGWNNLSRFADGLPFSLTLISILLAHEFGHYFACRFYGVHATLPYMLPAPTLSGTFGAIIRIKSKIKSRAALILIGTSGPIAGFAVAIVTTCYGLIHSKAMVAGAAPSLIRIGAPGLIPLLRAMLLGSNPDIPPLLQMVPHPVLVASWIGILITSINLIPAGQLDGGHILYALSPKLHRIMSQVMIGVLLYFGTFEWIGWLFWAFLLMLPAMRHPKIMDKAQLSIKLVAMAAVCLVIFLLTASTQPVTGMSLLQVLLRIHWGLWFR